MIKKILVGISALLLVALSLCGCGNNKNNDDIPNTNLNNNSTISENNFSGEIVDSVIAIPENSEEISENWEDGEFLYDGKKVKLICNFTELSTNLGLKFNDEKKNEFTLNPNYTVSGGQCTVGNTENIVISLINQTEQVQKYINCDVDTFSINIFNLKKNNNFEYSKIQLSKGITWDSTLEDIIAAYGEPEKRIDNEYGFNIYYQSSNNYSRIEFGFTNDLGLTSIYYTID